MISKKHIKIWRDVGQNMLIGVNNITLDNNNTVLFSSFYYFIWKSFLMNFFTTCYKK
jgi:hypothetical protein